MHEPPEQNLPSSSNPAALPDPGQLTTFEQEAAVRKVTRRLVPLLFTCYVIAYIDRINVGFAKLHLREALGVDEAVFNSVYGLGAGLFFLGYFLFEVPSNLILQRVGARLWIARIMVFWGLVSMAFVFIKSPIGFYVMRFLLGAAEAGFFPGVLLYLTYWFPARERARTIAMFAIGGIVAGVVGSPISGAILGLDGLAGLPGWKWLFLLEGLPAVVMGFSLLFLLPDRPVKARWLSAAARAYIQARVDAEVAPAPGPTRGHLVNVLADGRVWLLCLLYLLLNIGGYGYEMWLPSIIKGFSGASDLMVGFINAVPYFIAGVAMLVVARYSDRTGERRLVVAVAALASAIGFALSAQFSSPVLSMAALTLAFVGLKSAVAPFWAMSTAWLGATGAAAGIALINSVGNLGGFIGPYLVGVVKDRTGSQLAALLLLGTALLVMSLLAFVMRKAPQR